MAYTEVEEIEIKKCSAVKSLQINFKQAIIQIYFQLLHSLTNERKALAYLPKKLH
jgi:hypothetical protein